MGDFVVVYRKEKVLSTLSSAPEMSLDQGIKQFSIYEEAVDFFRGMITQTPKFEYKFRKLSENIEMLNATNCLLEKIHDNNEITQIDKNIIPYTVGEIGISQEYIDITENVLRLGVNGPLRTIFLATNAHNLSETKEGFYIYRESYEDVLNNMQNETVCISVTISQLKD